MTPPLQTDGVAPAALPPWVFTLIAVACGTIAANLYYPQPLVGPISASTGLAPKAAGLIVTMTQLGYAAGLFFIVPLGDLLENRRLIAGCLFATAAALGSAVLAHSAGTFLTIALLIGLGSSATQILVPYAAHFAPAEQRGRIVGSVMSGLLLGIMLARPFASLLTGIWNWHAVYVFGCVLILILASVLSAVLPPRRPAVRMHYTALLASLAHLARTNAVLRRRAVYQAFMFGAFSLFWTTAPLYLASPRFGFSQRGIALFALIGVAGAVAAPLAGHAADRGKTRLATGVAMLAVAASLLALLAVRGNDFFSLAVMVVASVVLDAGVSVTLVTGQREIYQLAPEFRSRLNGLYIATFFCGGAIASALAGWAFETGGWPRAVWCGLAMPLAAFIYFLTEKPNRSNATATERATSN